MPGHAVPDVEPRPEVLTQGELPSCKPLQHTGHRCHRHETEVVSLGRLSGLAEIDQDPLVGRTNPHFHEGSQGQADAETSGDVGDIGGTSRSSHITDAVKLPEIHSRVVAVQRGRKSRRALPGEGGDCASARNLDGSIAVAHVIGQRGKPRHLAQVEATLNRVRRRGQGRGAWVVVAPRLVGQGDSRLAHPVDADGGGDQQEEGGGIALGSRFSRFAPHQQKGHGQSDRKTGDFWETGGACPAMRVSLRGIPL